MPGNPLAISVRLEHRSLDRAASQRRHDLRLGPQPGYVDASRKDENSTVVMPKGAAELRALCEERRAKRSTKRRMKADAAVASCGIITFGREAQILIEALPRDDQDLAILAVAEAIAGRVGVELTGLVVHRDEAAIHAHFQMPAMAPDGQLVSQVVKPAVASELQSLAARVIAEFAPGIERGKRKGERLRDGDKPSEVIHKSVRQLHHELPADLAAAEARVAEAQARREEAEADLAKKVRLLDGTAAKLATATDNADKVEKRHATYERRVKSAQAELTEALEAVQVANRDRKAIEAQAATSAQEARRAASEVEGRVRVLETQEAALRASVEALEANRVRMEAEAASRMADLEKREAEVQAIEDERDLEGRYYENLTYALDRVQDCVGYAMAGTLFQEIDPGEQARISESKRFKDLMHSLPNVRLTEGRLCRLHALCDGTGGPVEIDEYARTVLVELFDQVDTWAAGMDAHRLKAEADAEQIVGAARKKAEDGFDRDAELRGRTAFVELLKAKVRDLFGEDVLQRLLQAVNAVWATHTDNPQRTVRQAYSSLSSSP